MADNRIAAVWLRRLAGLLTLASVLALTACGGGSGAPNNPFAPGPAPLTPVVVQPGSATAYSGVPTVLTITGGQPPYRAFSSNGTVLPVQETVNGNTIVLLPANVGADTAVTVTITDAAHQSTPVTVNVKPATLLNSLAIAPNRAECGAGLCSGGTGTASVVLKGPGGAPLASRQVRFEVVSGPFSILTNNPAQPTATSATATTDATGTAQVVVQANTNAATQPAQLRAIDVTTGQETTVNFVVVQNTSGEGIVSVLPTNASVQGVFTGECANGARVDYYVFGGTPPYRVTSSRPDVLGIVNTTVTTSGGFFEVVTNGVCPNSPVTFTITDATGRTSSAQLTNNAGSTPVPTTPPPTPAALTVAPASQTGRCANGATVDFNIVIAGGTPPYNVSAAPPPGGTAIVGPVSSSGVATISVSSPSAAGASANVVVRDSAATPQIRTVTITCA